MQKEYRLVIAPHAEQDLDDINEYITVVLCNVTAANKLLDKIEQKLNLLKSTPKMCPVVEFDELPIIYRKCVIDNYIAFYSVDDFNEEIIVERVVYAGRDLKNLL